jgi:hypothetical protein
MRVLLHTILPFGAFLARATCRCSDTNVAETANIASLANWRLIKIFVSVLFLGKTWKAVKNSAPFDKAFLTAPFKHALDDLNAGAVIVDILARRIFILSTILFEGRAADFE